MKHEVKVQIVEALEAYMAQHKLSANKVSEASGVNAAYISQMRKGEFSTTVGEKTVEIASKWFDMLATYIGMKLQKTYWQTVPTEQFTRTIATLEDAREYGYTNVIIGETGSGKTYAAGLFQKSNPADTYIITVGASDNITDLVDKVVDILHITPAKSKSKKIADIISKLREMRRSGAKPCLIFDEAEYMKQSALCAMKELYDNLHGNAGLILIGTDQLIRNIEKLKKRNKEGIPQFYRRIKFGIRTLPAIDRSFKQFLNDVEPGLKKFLKANCDNYGELHDVLVTAMREADRTGHPLTESFVRTILNIPA